MQHTVRLWTSAWTMPGCRLGAQQPLWQHKLHYHPPDMRNLITTRKGPPSLLYSLSFTSEAPLP